MTPRLVATDLDGTLVRSDGTISELTRRVLAELDERDVPVVIVTARPLRWMGDLWPMVGRHGFAIVSNGAIWYDVAAGRVRDLRGIEVEAGLRMCAAIAEAVPDAGFAIETLRGIAMDPGFGSPTSSASPRVTWRPSATCPTTSRCSSGPARRTPWPTPTRP
jgi:HAD superfamily hydrolase (TIGR01484 family)